MSPVKKLSFAVKFVFLAGAVFITVSCNGGGQLMQAVRNPQTGQVLVTEKKQKILQYNYKTVKPPEGFLASVAPGNRKYARARSDYIHPLYGPDGEELTLDWSKDHPHHRGIYWAWPEVDWKGRRGDLHALQEVFARPTGNIKLQSGNKFARIEAENKWLWDDKTPVVKETAIIKVYRSQACGRYIDLEFQFEAISDDVSLARRGTDKYGGLNIRLSPVKGMKLIHHADPVGSKPRIAWSDSIGTRAGGKGPVGLAVFEKITNPCYPGDWIEYPYLPWFQPTFPASGTRYVLKKGKKLVLKYRLWIRRCSETSNSDYARQWSIFNKTKK